MPDYYREAVDAAVGELRKPLADLDEAEQAALAERVLDILVSWDVFAEDSRGRIRGGSLLQEANRAHDEARR